MQVLLLFRDGGANRSGDIVLDKMVLLLSAPSGGAPRHTMQGALRVWPQRGQEQGPGRQRGEGDVSRAHTGRASRFKLAL